MHINYDKWDTNAKGDTVEELENLSKLLGKEIANDFLRFAVREEVIKEIERCKKLVINFKTLVRQKNQEMRGNQPQQFDIGTTKHYIFQYNMYKAILKTLRENVQ